MKPNTRILFFIFLLTFLSCEKDLYETPIYISKKNQSRLLNESERFKIQERVCKTLKRSKFYLSSFSENRISISTLGTVDFKEVLMISDESGKSTYTFKLLHPETSISKFYNLVLEEKGNYTILKLLEYTLSPEFGQQLVQNLNFKDFNGTVSSYTIFNDSPCPDEDLLLITVDAVGGSSGGGGSDNSNGSGNSTGSNGGSTSSSGGSGGSGSNSGTTEAIATPLNPSSNDDGDDEEVWVEVSQSPRYFRMGILQPNATVSSEESPCSPNLTFGLITPFTQCEKEFMNLSPHKLWLFQNQLNPIYAEIMAYINGEDENSCSVDRNSFIDQCLYQIIQNPGVFTSIKPFLIEKQIDDSELDDCTKGILDNLKQNHTIAKIIARFNEPNALFNLKFVQVSNLVNSENESILGEFSVTNQNYNYLIKLNTNFFNNNGATNLGKAKVIIHEMIHALIASVYQSGNNFNNSEDFPAIWNAYVNFEKGSTTPEDHAFMGYNYVELISNALQEYQPGFDSELYNDLAWSGIWSIKPSYYQFNDVLTGAKKAQILNRNNTEMERTTSYGMIPSSNNPCLQ